MEEKGLRTDRKFRRGLGTSPCILGVAKDLWAFVRVIRDESCTRGTEVPAAKLTIEAERMLVARVNRRGLIWDQAHG